MDVSLALVHMKFISVRSVEIFVTKPTLEPGLGGVRPVMAPKIISPDKADPAVLVGAGEGSGPHVVAQVSLQVVPLGEGFPAVLQVTHVTVGLGVFLTVWTLTGCGLPRRSTSPPDLSGERRSRSSTGRRLRDGGDEDVLSPGDCNHLPGHCQVLPQVGHRAVGWSHLSE